MNAKLSRSLLLAFFVTALLVQGCTIPQVKPTVEEGYWQDKGRCISATGNDAVCQAALTKLNNLLARNPIDVWALGERIDLKHIRVRKADEARRPAPDTRDFNQLKADWRTMAKEWGPVFDDLMVFDDFVLQNDPEKKWIVYRTKRVFSEFLEMNARYADRLAKAKIGSIDPTAARRIQGSSPYIAGELHGLAATVAGKAIVNAETDLTQDNAYSRRTVVGELCAVWYGEYAAYRSYRSAQLKDPSAGVVLCDPTDDFKAGLMPWYPAGWRPGTYAALGKAYTHQRTAVMKKNVSDTDPDKDEELKANKAKAISNAAENALAAQIAGAVLDACIRAECQDLVEKLYEQSGHVNKAVKNLKASVR